MDWTCLSSTSHRGLIRLRSMEFRGQVNTSNYFITLPSQLAFFPQCMLVFSVDAHATGHPHDVKEAICKTRLLPSIGPWSSSAVRMPIVGVFGSGHGSAWVPWLVCSYGALYITNCDALCQVGSLCSHRASMSLGYPQPCRQSTTVPSQNNF